MENRKFKPELLQVLVKTITSLTSQISLPELIEEIFEQLKHFVDYTACNIALIQEGRIYNLYSIGYEQYGRKDFVDHFSDSLEKLPLEKEIFEEKKPLLILDTLKSSEWVSFPETSWIRSRISLPLIFEDKVIGILSLDSHLPAKFSSQDLDLLQPLASAVAVALENARLFEELQDELRERKILELTLKESEERYRTVFENSSTAILIIEEDTTISMANKQFELLSGYSKEEIENKKSWQNFVHPDDLERMMRYHQQRRAPGGKAPKEYEFRFINKKGEVKDIFLKVMLIPGTKKSVATLMDITEHKKIEAQVKESEERFRLLFNYAPIAYYILDLEGTIIDSNKMAEELTGYFKKEFLNKNLFQANIFGNGQT